MDDVSRWDDFKIDRLTSPGVRQLKIEAFVNTFIELAKEKGW